VHLCLYWIRYS